MSSHTNTFTHIMRQDPNRHPIIYDHVIANGITTIWKANCEFVLKVIPKEKILGCDETFSHAL